MIGPGFGCAVLRENGFFLKESASDIDTARARYGEAVNALGMFAQGLYCLDYRGVHLWGHAIARLWREAQAGSLIGTDLEDVIRALWNPALLVVDFAQMSGHSEIARFVTENPIIVRDALAGVAIEGHGAIWLDEFGSGTPPRPADGAGRPVEPGSCGETAAMQRAWAIFACLLEETEILGTAGPDPLVQPEVPGSTLPASCNEISDQAFWGSSTGAGTVRPLNPEDLIAGGPTILPFIPEIFGPIDPILFDPAIIPRR